MDPKTKKELLERLQRSADASSELACAVNVEEIRAAEGEDGRMVMQGHAAVFSRRSLNLGGFTEILMRGCFRKVLDTNPDVRLLFNHDPNHPLARTANQTLDLSEDPKGLRVFAELADTTIGRDVAKLLERGDVSQMSFGFRIAPEGDTWEVDEQGNVTRYINDIEELFDVSVVTYPAYPQTDAKMRSINIAGAELVDIDGNVQEDALRALANQIHAGDVQVDDEQRSVIDQIFNTKTSIVSPWTAERTLLACAQDQELLAAVRGHRATVALEPTTGEDSSETEAPAEDEPKAEEPEVQSDEQERSASDLAAWDHRFRLLDLS